MVITLKKQHERNNCMSACLAMILGLTVEEVTINFNADFHSLKKSPIDFCSLYGVVLERTEDRYNIGHGYVYILAVPSLNATGLLHTVLLDYRTPEPVVFDPSTGKTYSLDPIEPGECKLVSWIVEYRLGGE